MMTILHISHYRRSDNTAQVPLATIAAQMGMSRRQVRNYIASLRAKGLILTDERSTDRAGQTASAYDLTPFIDQMNAHPRQDPSYPLGTILPTPLGTKLPRDANPHLPRSPNA
jgi:hypothetical protein